LVGTLSFPVGHSLPIRRRHWTQIVPCLFLHPQPDPILLVVVIVVLPDPDLLFYITVATVLVLVRVIETEIANVANRGIGGGLHHTYNLLPSCSRRPGTQISSKKPRETTSLRRSIQCKCDDNVLLTPASVEFSIWPVIISPLKGRKTINLNSTTHR